MERRVVQYRSELVRVLDTQRLQREPLALEPHSPQIRRRRHLVIL
jgi:hypothetical protein